MIDSHCHLEQKDYSKDLDAVIDRCKKAGIKALISSCPDPRDFDRALEVAKKYKGYVFLAAAIHPEYIKEFPQKEIDSYFELLRKNKNNLVGIGETGLDYFWVPEPKWREKQKELFVRFIEFSKELKLPLMVHTRDEVASQHSFSRAETAHEDVVKILEQEGAKKVHLHMWGGREQIETINRNGWYISVGPIIATSKNHKKVVRDIPLERIMLETDSPWFGGRTPNGKPMRGEPTNIKIPAQEIADVKKLSFEEVWKACGENAKRFYSLSV